MGLGIPSRTLFVLSAMVLLGTSLWLSSGSALAGAIPVVGLLLATVSPQGALYATCAAIPLIFHPVHIGSLQLGLLEVGILVTAAGTALRLAFDLVDNRESVSLKWLGSRRSWILPGLLLLVATLSLIWMPFDSHRAEALRTWRWVIVEPVLLFTLARMAIDRDGPTPLTMAIVLPAGIVALAGVWQLGAASSDFSVDAVHRSTATYLHPNNLALYLERAFMLVSVPAFLIRSRLRWPLAAISAVLLVGLATTFSRGALLGIGFGFAVVLLARPIRNGFRWLLVAVMVMGGSFVLLAGDRFSGADSSGFVQTRRYLWVGAIDMIRDSPLSGIGLDQFLWLNQSRYIDPRIWSERYVSHPHNVLLDSWLSLGLAGAVLLVALTIVGGWLVWQGRTGRVALSAWQLGALGCLAAGLGHGIVDNGYFLSDLSAMTWLAIALLLANGDEKARLADG